MGRYYFDLRDSEGLAVDEEGLELHNLQEAGEEAALSLADAARDGLCRADGSLNQLSIEVRTTPVCLCGSVSRSIPKEETSMRTSILLIFLRRFGPNEGDVTFLPPSICFRNT